MKSQKKLRNQRGQSPTKQQIEGVISVNSRGIGFVVNPKGKTDIEIPTTDLNTALNRDLVQIIIDRPKSRPKPQGQVTKIVERAKSQFVGTLEYGDSGLTLSPDDKKFYTKIKIIESNHIPGVKPDFKALVRIFRWQNQNVLPEGQIVQVIGKKGENDTEMQAIALEHGTEISFNQAVENEANQIKLKEWPIKAEEIARRRDFRKTLTFTIDPKDAKDFDDAISFRDLGGGQFEIGVHIADVSHYVRENSALDQEALKRGLSTYLVDRTIPMLPEVLSNDLCSLNPNEDKLAFSAVFEIDSKARVQKRWFGQTIIRSDKRFTYENAQESLDNPSGPYHTELTILNSLAKIMQKEKFAKGAIDFEQDEVKFDLDPAGRPIRIYKKARLDTHKLVEEFMLLANKEVAEFIFKAHNKKTGLLGTSIYRIHDTPDREKIADLSIFLRALGYDLPIKKDGSVNAKDLQAIIQASSGKAEGAIIRTAAIRSMAKAIYSTRNIGHFGLAFEYYTHFTSPIRRYADLLVHRVLARHLDGSKIPQNEWGRFEQIAEAVSEREIEIAEAERASIKYKQIEYMQNHLGEVFEGVISGVTGWGIYVEERNTRAEGMVRVRSLGDDYFILDEKNYALVGERTKKKWSLGDQVKFKITSVDLERKSMDLELI